MAKVVKATRDIVDVEEEVKKVSPKKDKTEEKKKTVSKTSKKTMKKEKKQHGGPIQFLKEVKAELAKVKWPSRKDMIKYSVATICFVIFFGVFFYAIEAIMALVKAWV